MNFLSQNLITITVGVIGLMAAYIFYRRSLIKPKLAYRMKSIQVTGLQSTFSPELEIVFRGKKVPLVTKSTIVIWNFGNATIDGDRIVDADPLRIVTSDNSEILEASVVSFTREVNGVSVKVRPDYPNQLTCTFDYLDSGDGAVINVLHTGSEKVNVTGTIRGLPKGLVSLNNVPKEETRSNIGAWAGGLLILSTLLSLLVLWQSNLSWFLAVLVLLSPAFVIGFILIAVLLAINKRLPPNIPFARDE